MHQLLTNVASIEVSPVLTNVAKGFNLIVNTDFAAQVLAVLSESGCRLSNVLQLGPVNGPFDFSFIMD